MATARLSRWLKARQVLASQGVGGLLEELSARLRHRIAHPTGGISYHDFRTRDWDRRRGVETEDLVEQESLDFDSPNRGHALGYVPTGHWSFRAVVGLLRDLGVRPPEFALVDFGCGKGRVLLMALE